MAKRRTRFTIKAALFAATCALGVSAGLQNCAMAEPAPSFSERDVQIVARALGFVHPPPSGEGWVAVVFAPGDAAGRRDAERIAALFGEGLRTGGALLRAHPVSADALASGGHAALIAAAGAPGDALMAAARSQRIPCITSVIEQVEAGRCMFWVRSLPRVEILVSRAATQASGLGLAAAFRMMVREI